MKDKKNKTHGVQLLLRAVVTDPDGKVISDTGEKPAQSFLIQFLELVFLWFRGSLGKQSATQIDGTEDYIYWGEGAAYVWFPADANDGSRGVVIGTGDTAVTNTDYKLENKIAEGSGATQMTHGAVTVNTTGVVGANVDLLITRSFTNNSGGAITVKEAGFYVEIDIPTVYPFFCMTRDTLSAPVPDKCSLTLHYTLRTTG